MVPRVDAFGRRNTLLWTGILVVLAGAASGLAPDIYTFAALRFLTGAFHPALACYTE